jgi:hypothetical protein
LALTVACELGDGGSHSGSWSLFGLVGLVGLVGSELDHLLGAAAGDGADELAGDEDLEDGGVQSDGDDVASAVAAG